LRRPELVAKDVERGRLSRENARRIYGVVLTDDGGPDAAATGDARSETLARRLADAVRRPGDPIIAGTDARKVGFALETVEVVEDKRGRHLSCVHCRAVLGSPVDGYRDGCAWLETALSELDPRLYVEPSRQVDTGLVVRQYLCPACGYSLDADVCVAGDAAYQDVSLEVASSGGAS
jgi:N-methylhydantoinase B